MKKLTTMLACLAMLNLAACDDKDDNDEDTATDTAVDTTPTDTVEDTGTPDVPEDTDTPDVPTDVEEEEGPMTCEDDATHLYIDLSGTVNGLPPGSVEGLYVAAISPMDALTNPTPTPLASTTTDADGNWSLECVNVFNVLLGIVILVDDNPEDGTAGALFPTGTGVQGWDVYTEAVDVTGATAMAVSNTLVTGLEALSDLDAETNGFVMGMVVDSSTGAPVDGATVARADAAALSVHYPNADFSGLETDDTTSVNGTWFVDTGLALTNLTAEATGLTFGEHPVATKAGFCYFSMITSE